MELVTQLEYLFAGFAVFWAGLLTYLVLLQSRLRMLSREVERLESRLRESGAAPTAQPARTAPASAVAGAPPSGV